VYIYVNQKDKNMKSVEKLLLGMVIGFGICMLLSILTSCKTGYGCRGNQSWDKMVKRNNRP
jgi:hypothetical protein